MASQQKSANLHVNRGLASVHASEKKSSMMCNNNESRAELRDWDVCTVQSNWSHLQRCQKAKVKWGMRDPSRATPQGITCLEGRLARGLCPVLRLQDRSSPAPNAKPDVDTATCTDSKSTCITPLRAITDTKLYQNILAC